MTWYFVRPTDLVLFREPGPFDAAEGHVARSRVPPTPRPLLGALRAVAFRRAMLTEIPPPRGHPMNERYGDANGYGRLRARGPFLARSQGAGVDAYFPAPLNTLRREGSGDLFELQPLRHARLASFWDLGLRPLWASFPTPGEPPDGQVLSANELLAYLRGGVPRTAPASSLFVEEQKVGIALDPLRKAAQPGMLYVARLHRFHEDCGLLFDLELPEADDPWAPAQLLGREGTILLGGERRPGSYSAADLAPATRALLDPAAAAEAVAAQGGPPWRVKLLLATPALFPGGWRLPEAVLAPWRAELVSCAVGKPTTVGGWDLARQAPRPSRRAVPAGSVYFLEVNGDLHDFCRAVHGRGLPGQVEDLGAVGFGTSLVGSWRWA